MACHSETVEVFAFGQMKCKRMHMATSLPYIMYNEYKWFTENGMWHKDTGNENQLHIYNDPTRTNHKVEQLPQLSQLSESPL